MKRLSKSGIEYLNYSWGIYSGCENWCNGVCPVGKNCWAKRITERFESHYPYGFKPTFHPKALLSPMRLKKPSRISVGWTGDMFGDWMMEGRKIPDAEGELWSGQGILESVFRVIVRCQRHNFLILTKCPQNLPKWSPFPDNCWVGVTCTNRESYIKSYYHLAEVEAKVKYISFEPLLEHIEVTPVLLERRFQWVIIGGQTKPTKLPRIDAVREIVEAADWASIPVFQKDNLKPLLGDNLRQEMPIER